MKTPIFTGAGVAIVTPMNADGSINYTRFGEIIEEQIAGGTDAIVVVGTTGEASTMTDEEHIEAIRFTAEKVAKRIPVIAGTGSNDTGYAIELSRQAEAAGADALLQVTPYYNKTSQRGLVAHFNAIADSVNIPIILYNVPSRTGVSIQFGAVPVCCEKSAGQTAKNKVTDTAVLRLKKSVLLLVVQPPCYLHRAQRCALESVCFNLSFFIRLLSIILSAAA